MKTAAQGVSRALAEHVRQVERPALRTGQSASNSNGQPVVTHFPFTKKEILSHYSGCFKGIG